MIVAENAVDFNHLEEEIFETVCSLGREMLKQALEAYDWSLTVGRDRVIYRHKGLRQTAIKTMMGTVEYRRAVYERKNADGSTNCVFLLDEAMGRNGSGFYSGLLTEVIVNACCSGSYRDAAREISEMTGQTVSHTAAWTVVQEIGGRVDVQEQQAVQAAAAHKGAGKLEAQLLFEEQDGIHLALQGKSRKQYGSRREMKLAIAYDGAKKAGKKRYELTNKVACANFEPAGKFIRRKEGAIAAVYSVDEIETRLLNGDGAEWIKQSVSGEAVYFQLDPFHRNKAVRQWVRDDEKRALIFELLYSKRIDDLLGCIEGYINCLDDAVEEEAAEKENLQKLLTYFTNNKDGLVPCHRRGLGLPQPPEGLEYRRMGCAESNIFTILGNRMKGRRACWSIDGGNNMARLLCLKATKRLSMTLQSLTSLVLPEKYAEEIRILMPSKVPNSEGKGYNGHHQATTFPATPDYKWLKGLGALRPLTEI